MTDIDTLEGDALNRAVAEALGWTITGDRPWYIRGSEGQEYTTDAVHLGLAWERAIYVHGYIPDFAHNLDAALALPCDEIWQLSIYPDGLVSVYITGEWFTQMAQIATVVCRAWLKYRRAQADTDAQHDRRDMWRPGAP